MYYPTREDLEEQARDTAKELAGREKRLDRLQRLLIVGSIAFSFWFHYADAPIQAVVVGVVLLVAAILGIEIDRLGIRTARQAEEIKALIRMQMPYSAYRDDD